MASILGTGTMWIKVPETIKVVIEGELPKNVMSKDIILRLREIMEEAENKALAMR